MDSYQGELKYDGKGQIYLVAAHFNAFIVDHLVQGAVDQLQRHGVPETNLHLVRVPGAFELPLAVKRVLALKQCHAVVALGAVIRGATPHFEYVAGECARQLAQLQITYDKPVGFGLLTTDTIEQAIERAGTKAGNKGADAALATLEMINVLRKL